MGKKQPLYSDEIYVERMSGMGLYMGGMIFPSKMREGIIKAYMDSGAVTSSYLYVNGKEITDGKNHNPFRGIK